MDNTLDEFVRKVLYHDKSYYIMLYHDAMEPLFSLKNGPLTRSRLAKYTKACRFWQLFCAILFSIYKQNTILFDSLIHQNKKGVNATRRRVQQSVKLLNTIHRTIERIYSNKYSNLYKIIFNNEKQVCESEEKSVCAIPIEYIDDLLTSEPHYYGICIGNKISHYFTIYKTEKDTYHLSSSYGSDFIHSPANTQEITLQEFSQFIDAIHTNNQRIITRFYNKFFFVNPSTIYSANIEQNEYTPYTEKGYFKSAHIKNGPSLELNQSLFHIINTRTPAQEITLCELIYYQDEIDTLIHQIGGSLHKKPRNTRRGNKRIIRWGKNTYRNIPARNRSYE